MSAKLLGAYQRHSSTSPAGTFGLNDRIGPKDRKKISKFGRKIQIPLPIVYTKVTVKYLFLFIESYDYCYANFS